MPDIRNLADLQGLATIRVYPDLATVLDLSKDAAYAAVARGEIPSLRLGRRIVIPVPALLHLLGADAA